VYIGAHSNFGDTASNTVESERELAVHKIAAARLPSLWLGVSASGVMRVLLQKPAGYGRESQPNY